MPKRARGSRRRRQTNRGGTQFFLNVPTAGTVAEGNTLDLSYNTFFVKSTFFQDAPWRLVSINVQCSATHINATDQQVLEPSVLQIGLNSGSSSNIENVTSKRVLVTHIATKFWLRMPNPNVWKENEQRDQALISLSNVGLGGGVKGGVLWFLIQAKFQFRQIPFTLNSLSIQRDPDCSSGSREFVMA